MKIKIEINTREHCYYDPLNSKLLESYSQWFQNTMDITTFTTEELLATKLRALYQRKKGRDLFDLWVARELNPNTKRVFVEIFKKYLNREDKHITQGIFEKNIHEKVNSNQLAYDLRPLISPSLGYDVHKAYDYVLENYIQKL